MRIQWTNLAQIVRGPEETRNVTTRKSTTLKKKEADAVYFGNGTFKASWVNNTFTCLHRSLHLSSQITFSYRRDLFIFRSLSAAGSDALLHVTSGSMWPKTPSPSPRLWSAIPFRTGYTGATTGTRPPIFPRVHAPAAIHIGRNYYNRHMFEKKIAGDLNNGQSASITVARNYSVADQFF